MPKLRVKSVVSLFFMQCAVLGGRGPRPFNFCFVSDCPLLTCSIRYRVSPGLDAFCHYLGKTEGFSRDASARKGRVLSLRAKSSKHIVPSF